MYLKPSVGGPQFRTNAMDNREKRAAMDDSREKRAAMDDSRETRAAMDDSREKRAAMDDSRETRAAMDDSREKRAAMDDSRETRAAMDDSREKRAWTSNPPRRPRKKARTSPRRYLCCLCGEYVEHACFDTDELTSNIRCLPCNTKYEINLFS